MNNDIISETVEQLISEADANVSLLMKDMDTGAVLHAHNADAAVSSASTIKVPIMLAVLQQVMHGRLSLDSLIEVPACQILDDTEVFDGGPGLYPLQELLYWMIVSSDNTATNVLIGLLGFETVIALAGALGVGSTVLARRMLDFEALKNGRDNRTSAADMAVVFEAIYHNRILSPGLCSLAMDILQRQRSTDGFLRYIADGIAVAHKTGGLDPVAGHDRVSHDAGIFLLGNIRYYLGIFITAAPDDAQYAHRLIGRLSKVIYDCYKE
jgi:beta-lactamase class A